MLSDYKLLAISTVFITGCIMEYTTGSIITTKPDGTIIKDYDIKKGTGIGWTIPISYFLLCI